MRFSDWVESQGYGVLKRLERELAEHRIGYTTLLALKDGERVPTGRVAKLVSGATGGAVSITELIDPPPPAAAPKASKRRTGKRATKLHG